MPVRILDWSDFGAVGENLVSGNTVETDGIAVSFEFLEQDEQAAARNFEVGQFVAPGEPFDPTEGLKLSGEGGVEDGMSDTSTTILNFSSASEDFGDTVQHVLFRINDVDTGQQDLDFTDVLKIRAFDADGNEVPVDLTPGALVETSGQLAFGNDVDDPIVTPPTDPDKSLLVSIAGPVARVEIEYDNDGPDAQAAWITDIKFETTDPDNDGLVANDDEIETDEDTAASVVVTANDTDPQGDTLSVTGLDTTGLTGSAAVEADGQTVTFDPDGQFEALGDGDTVEESFDYTVEDADGNTATATVFVAITGVNDDPAAVDDDASGIGTQTIEVLANDTDPEGDPLTVINVTSGTNGTTTINVNGTVTYTPAEGFTGDDSFTYEISDGNGGTDTATVTVEVLPCFTPGTVIATPRGECRVEDLQVGDRVITRDNGLQEIRWIGRRTLSPAELRANPQLCPVLVRVGALGHGLPERDLLVSPQHRLLMNSDRAALYFEEREVLAAAKHLTDLEGVDVAECETITYIHIMFDQHEVVLSNGSWTESFQPGAQTMDGLGDEQRDEIYAIFPELREKEGLAAYQAARRSLKKHEAGLLSAG